MRKKTMRAWFVLLFVIGLVIGYLLPGNIHTVAQKPLQAGIYDVPKRMGQLDQETPYYKYMSLGGTLTGSTELLRIDGKVPLHAHDSENHFAFIYKGSARVTLGTETWDVKPGTLLAIPAKVPHAVERIGDSPLEIVLFSTPPFMSGKTAFLNQTQ